MGYGDLTDYDLDNPYRAPESVATPEKKGMGQYIGYAGFWIRVVATIIDNVLLGIVGFVIGIVAGIAMIASNINPVDPGPSALLNLIGILLNLGYYAGMQSSSTQATLGKMVVGIKVTDLYGHRISFGRALGREVSKILSALLLLIGFLMVAFDPKKQGLHDKLAGTLVLRTR